MQDTVVTIDVEPSIEIADYLKLLMNKIDRVIQFSAYANSSLDSTKELHLWPPSLSNRSMSVLAAGLFSAMNNYRILYVQGIKSTQNIQFSPAAAKYLTNPHAFNVDPDVLVPAFHSASFDFTQINQQPDLLNLYSFDTHTFPLAQSNVSLRRQTFNAVMPSAELLHSTAQPTSSFETTKKLFTDLRELVMKLSVDLYGKPEDTTLTNDFIMKHGKSALLESLPLIHPYITDAESLLNSDYARKNLMDTQDILRNIVNSFSNVLYYLHITLSNPTES